MTITELFFELFYSKRRRFILFSRNTLTKITHYEKNGSNKERHSRKLEPAKSAHVLSES